MSVKMVGQFSINACKALGMKIMVLFLMEYIHVVLSM
jgi:hypothetical protein